MRRHHEAGRSGPRRSAARLACASGVSIFSSPRSHDLLRRRLQVHGQRRQQDWLTLRARLFRAVFSGTFSGRMHIVPSRDVERHP